MKPESVAALRHAGVLAEDIATEVLTVAPTALSSAQRIALDGVSYVMAALSAILVDLADIWDHEREGK